MAVVHRFIQPDRPRPTEPRAGQGEADIVILPCIRRERLLEREAALAASERGRAPVSNGDDARP